MQGARPPAERAHVAFAHHVFNGPLVRSIEQVREFGVIAGLEIFIHEVRGRGIDAFVRRDEVTNAAHAIGRLITILPDHAFVAGPAAAIDVGFVLVLHHVIARGDAHGQTRIRAAGIARSAHAIAVARASIAERTRIAGHPAAINVGFVLIFDSVIACRYGRTCFRHAIAIHRTAIAVLRAHFTKTASRAFRTTAIDVRLVLVLDSVVARRRCNTFGRIRIADVARAIAIHRASFANVARGTRSSAAIDVGFCAVLRAVITRRRSLARLRHWIAQITRAIAISRTNLAYVACVALRAAAIDVRFVLILRAIATGGRSRISTSHGRHAIVTYLAILCAIQQINPLTTTIHIRSTALNLVSAALRRANGGTAVIARTSSTATSATNPFPSGTSAATFIGRSRRRSGSITTAERRRAPEDQHEECRDLVRTHFPYAPAKNLEFAAGKIKGFAEPGKGNLALFRRSSSQFPITSGPSGKHFAPSLAK